MSGPPRGVEIAVPGVDTLDKPDFEPRGSSDGAPERKARRAATRMAGFCQLDRREVLRVQRLGPHAASVWMSYASHANREGQAWPGYECLHQETGLARGTIAKAIRCLKQVGALVPVGRKGRGRTVHLVLGKGRGAFVYRVSGVVTPSSKSTPREPDAVHGMNSQESMA